jgi:DNA polymerase III epsilon subunit-like protein
MKDETCPIILHVADHPSRDLVLVNSGVEYRVHREPSSGRLFLIPDNEPYVWNPALVFIDTETGGLNPAKDAILQVGLFHPSSGISMEILVNDTVGDVSEKALEVNQLSLDTVRNSGLCVNKAAEAVSAFIQRVKAKVGKHRMYSVGHNVSFDTAFLRRLFMLANAKCPREFLFNRSIDTHAMLYLRDDPTSLDAALEKYQIPKPSSRHTALADAKLTAELYRRITSD